MIAGACFTCGKLNQIYKRNDRYCASCGKLLARVVVLVDSSNRPFAKIESEEA